MPAADTEASLRRAANSRADSYLVLEACSDALKKRGCLRRVQTSPKVGDTDEHELSTIAFCQSVNPIVSVLPFQRVEKFHELVAGFTEGSSQLIYMASE